MKTVLDGMKEPSTWEKCLSIYKLQVYNYHPFYIQCIYERRIFTIKYGIHPYFRIVTGSISNHHSLSQHLGYYSKSPSSTITHFSLKTS